MTEATWSEADSAVFLDRGRYYVPEREIQTGIIATLLEDQPAAMRIVELCPGDGHLATALLRRYPGARLLALDGSPMMLARTRRAAAAFRDRLQTRAFDLADRSWRRLDGVPVNAVVSVLAVHHLDAQGKRRLFADLHAALAPDGILVLADMTEPPTAIARRVAADAWDEEVRRQGLALDGNEAILDRFAADEWNYYRHLAPGADPIDKPSSLVEHLDWLRQAGFQDVDVHWMKAGHAIMSGVKRSNRS